MKSIAFSDLVDFLPCTEHFVLAGFAIMLCAHQKIWKSEII